MNTILVTGATGFIGSHLIKRLRESGEKVISLIHDEPIWTTWLTEALGGTVLIRGDIRDFNLLKRVLVNYEVDRCVHLASQAIVSHAYKDPVNTFDINVLGSIKLLEACRQVGVKYVICQSTDKCYGNQKGATVESRLIPTEPYSASKIAMDIAAQSFIETYGQKICITRCCNVYGYDPSNRRIVPNTVKDCLSNRQPIIYKDDKSARQYIFIHDVTRTFMELMENKMTGVVNIATDTVLTQEAIVLTILRYFPELKPKYVEKPELKEITSQSMIPDYPRKYTPFEDGIKLTIDAFRKWGF